MPILYCDHYRQDMGVYSKRTDLEQVHSRNLCQHLQSTQYQWTVQYHKRYTYFAGADKVRLEFENGQNAEDRGRIGFYCRVNVRSSPSGPDITYCLLFSSQLKVQVTG